MTNIPQEPPDTKQPHTHPSPPTPVIIDDYNEANIELAFMLLSLPAAAQFILDNLKKHPQETAEGQPGGHTDGPPPTLQPQLFKTLETCPD